MDNNFCWLFIVNSPFKMYVEVISTDLDYASRANSLAPSKKMDIL